MKNKNDGLRNSYKNNIEYYVLKRQIHCLHMSPLIDIFYKTKLLISLFPCTPSFVGYWPSEIWWGTSHHDHHHHSQVWLVYFSIQWSRASEIELKATAENSRRKMDCVMSTRYLVIPCGGTRKILQGHHHSTNNERMSGSVYVEQWKGFHLMLPFCRPEYPSRVVLVSAFYLLSPCPQFSSTSFTMLGSNN